MRIIFTLSIGLALGYLSGCGEVKVMDEGSPLASVDPINEIVSLKISDAGLSGIECLSIKKPALASDVTLNDGDHDVFESALKAHLAPLNYPTKENCPQILQLTIKEYRVRDLMIASQLIVDLDGDIKDSRGNRLWSAHYRLAENAGSLPLDPISAGFGMFSAAKNSSNDSKHNGIYLAVRRLLLALPEHEDLEPRPAEEPVSQISSSTEIEQVKKQPTTLVDALMLWDQGQQDEAISVLSALYSPDLQAAIGYQYGLMLETVGRDEEAAVIYADTSIDQARTNQPEASLRTLRRLQRMNETNEGRHEPDLDRAIQEISQLLRR